ncbi:flagellar basal body P-ring protein FlgI [Schlesneria sp.]|uniref:flagellar basal body P-ring protein FlgI n=1 Tax=Schlesneria sp. TaxID=2762018 RepID=UPI002F1E9D20
MNEFNSTGFSRRHWLHSAAIAAATPALLWARPAAPIEINDEDEEDDQKYQTKVNTPLIGDHTTFAGLDPIVLHGVGLVRGLSGTGGDPAPSQFRSLLMEDLKQQGYRVPNAILESPTTALVTVRAYLSPTAKKGDRLDVEVQIPESANATSLVGGELLDVRLSDKAMVGGELKSGWDYAIARGPVLTAGLAAHTTTEPALLRRGRVLSGAVVKKERELSMFLKNDFRSVRNAQRIADAIGRRFHHFDEHGIKKPLATAKTDQRLVLSVHPRYRDNFPRYLQVIRHMAFREEPIQLRVRMTRLAHDLQVPETAHSSALQLEAIGNDSIPILKKGIVAPTLESRFHSAVALAYLGDSSGLPALVEAARKERAFRVFALSAISTLEDAEAHLALRELMNEANDETRYGAFRALWTLDRNDPFIRGERLGIREGDENLDNEYKLHVVHTTGPDLVHVTLRTRPEIVVFGAHQEFRPPMYASAGKKIIVTAQPGATTVSLARFEVGKPDERKEVSLKVADVIRAANELGATYPDVLQLLADTSKQKNLAVPLAADKLPAAGRVYHRPSADAITGGKRAVKIGRDQSAPGSFPAIHDPDEAARRKEDSAREERGDDEERSGTMANIPVEPINSEPAEMESSSSRSSKKKGDKSKGSWSWFNKK